MSNLIYKYWLFCELIVNFLDPISWFDLCYLEASKACENPSVMCVATCGLDLKPSARFVLLKRYDQRGFIFYSSSLSRKAEQLRENPNASVAFYWDATKTQVRVEGCISEVSAGEADIYFASRSREKQISAHLSKQSQVIPEGLEISSVFESCKKEYSVYKKIPRPYFWNGFLLCPNRFEFWKEGDHRLNSRTEYIKSADNQWIKRKLYP